MRLDGFTSKGVGHILGHNSRESVIEGRENIDSSLSHLNYTIGMRSNPMKFIREKTDGLVNRSDQNVMSEIVVTLPEELMKFPERYQRAFFQCVYDELTEQVGGPENVVGATVHLDEPGARPHMHFDFVAVLETPKMVSNKDKPLKNKDGSLKKNKRGTQLYEREPLQDENGQVVVKKSLAQAKMFTRTRLKTFHNQVDKNVTIRLNNFFEEHNVKTKSGQPYRIERCGLKKVVTEDQAIQDALNSVPIKYRKALERYIASERAEIAQERQNVSEREKAVSEREKALEALEKALKGREDGVAKKEAEIAKIEDVKNSAVDTLNKEFERLAGEIVRRVEEAYSNFQPKEKVETDLVTELGSPVLKDFEQLQM